MPHCLVSRAALRNAIKQLLAVHVTAVQIITKNASSDPGISPNFSPKIGTAKRTSKCIKILTDISFREDFFYFSHKNVPDMKQSAQSSSSRSSLSPGPLAQWLIKLSFNYRRGQLGSFLWSLERCLNWEWNFPLCILSRFEAFSRKWNINGHINRYSQ